MDTIFSLHDLKINNKQIDETMVPITLLVFV